MPQCVCMCVFGSFVFSFEYARAINLNASCLMNYPALVRWTGLNIHTSLHRQNCWASTVPISFQTVWTIRCKVPELLRTFDHTDVQGWLKTLKNNGFFSHFWGFLRSGSRQSWGNFYSGKQKLQQMSSFFHSHSPKSKRKIHNSVSKRGKSIKRLIIVVWSKKDVIFAVSPSAVVLETLNLFSETQTIEL